MKPLQIMMSAFGSYAGEVQVDFERVSHGIFLITGDTGAGKTTIFDAVMFALYGETSGGRREGSMMRSQYAKEECDTFVKLRFRVRNQVYEVFRSPAYMRRSKKKNKDGVYKEVAAPAKAVLFMPDGTELPGNIRDINQKIQEIVGVDSSQFSQIVMIAQGEYVKLLHASSRERKEIFSRIFNTGIYSRIQQKLTEEYKRRSAWLEDNTKLYEHEKGRIACRTKEEWDALKELGGHTQTGPKEVEKWLEELTNKQGEQAKELQRQRDALQEELTSLQQKILQVQETNRLLDQKELAEEAWKRLAAEGEEQQALRRKLQMAQKALEAARWEDKYQEQCREHRKTLQSLEQIEAGLAVLKEEIRGAKDLWEQKQRNVREKMPGLTEELTRLKDSIPEYRKWQEKVIGCEQDRKKVLFMQERLAALEEEEEESKQRQKIWNREQEGLEKCGQDLMLHTQKLQSLLERQEALKDLQTARELLEKDRKDMCKKQKKAEAALLAYQAAGKDYDRKNHSFIGIQAGILAKSLEDDMPCPVCGSRKHPQKAELSGDAVTEKQVEQAKKERDKADEILRQAADESGRAVQLVKSKEDALNDQCSRLLGEEYRIMEELSIWDSQAGHLIQEAIGACQAEIEEEKSLVEIAEQNQKKLRDNKKKLEKAKKRLEEIEIEYREAALDLQKCRIDLEKKQAEASQLKSRLAYQTEEEASRVYRELLHCKELLEKEEQTARERRESLMQREKEETGRLSQTKALAEEQKNKEARLFEKFLDIRKEQGFSDEESYRQARQDEETMQTWEQDCRNYEKALLKAQTSYEQYREQTEGKQRADLNFMESKSAELAKEREGIQKEWEQMNGICMQNQSALAQISKILRQRQKLQEEYQVIYDLYRTANGKLSGTAGLDFQTYVQRQYFKQMIYAANKRLIYMSGQQFILQCRDLESLGKQGEVGLDLDVYSLTTDKTRDVKTLSGGESFMAALAMALGMADVIQNTAGKIQLDTMFIDEGFGSLDEESRTRAVRILQELAGEKRLIGIISHVSELKEQMDRKLIVQKTKKGSLVRWEL